MLPLSRPALRPAVLGVLLASIVVAGPALPAQASAGDGGLVAAIRFADAVHPVVVLTNHGSQACRVATIADGTLALTSVEHDGVAIAPQVSAVDYPDPLDQLIKASLRDLAPGETVELPVRTGGGDGGPSMLWSSSWSRETGAIAVSYQFGDASVQLTVRYALPIAVAGACEPATGDSATASAATAGDSARWLVIGGIALALALLAIAVIVLFRRRRGRSGPAATALSIALAMVIGVSAGALARPEPAAASIHPKASSTQQFKDQVEDCLKTLRAPGGDPAGILPTLDADDVRIIETPNPVSEAEPQRIVDTWEIDWNPTTTAKFAGGDTNHWPCTDLYHELFHIYERIKGTTDQSDCWVTRNGLEVNTHIRISEVKATRAENKLRAVLNKPLRTKYGAGNDLPSEECHHEQPQRRPGTCPIPERSQPLRDAPAGRRDVVSACHPGTMFGDPHLWTIDQASYGFQAVGEFVASRDTRGGFTVQTRLAPLRWNTGTVSFVTAVAMDVAGDRVQVDATPERPTVTVNGTVTPLPTATVTLPRGGTLRVDVGGATWWSSSTVIVTWPDGSIAAMPWYDLGFLYLDVFPASVHRGQLAGLLGNFDGDAQGDVRPATGDPLSVPPSYDALYPSFADSWRVGTDSLFSYAPGTSTETFTDRAYPRRPVDPSSLPNRAWAEAVCRYLGVLAPADLAACVYDVAITGDITFASSAKTHQDATVGLSVDSGPATVTVAAGQVGRVEFVGRTAQKVYVDVVAPALPTACGMIRLLDPDGKVLGTGCLTSGQGRVAATVLPADGLYTVEIDPPGDAAGEATVTVITAADQGAGIVIDGPEVTATITTAGSTATYSFTGTAGQAVFLDVPATTLPIACGVFAIVGPDAKSLNTGCVTSGAGYVDRTVLPTDGAYQILVDPADAGVGTARLKLYGLTDQVGTIELSGSPVTAAISEPGALATFTFTGTAGQRVFLDIANSTLPTECGFSYLLDASGKHVVDGCIIGGAGYLDPAGTVLPATGQYTIVVESRGAGTGVATLRLHT